MIGNINLEDDYGIDYTFRQSTIGDEFAVGTDAARVTAATAKYPWWIAYCTCDCARSGLVAADRVPTPGTPIWTDAQILACSSFVAAHNDAIWATSGPMGGDGYFGALPWSRAQIEWPHGSYYINYPLILANGHYYGQGTAQLDLTFLIPPLYVTGGTGLFIWQDEWLDITGYDDGPKKYLLASMNMPYAKDGVLYSGALGIAPTAYLSPGSFTPGGLTGTYAQVTPLNGKWSGDFGVYRFYWTGTTWNLINTGTAAIYFTSSEDVNYPWQVTAWTAVTGTGTFSLSEVNSVLDTYMEGMCVSDVRLEGEKALAPEAVDGGETFVTTYEDAGIAVWRLGSVSDVSRVHADRFNNAGFQWFSGIPGTMSNLRSFFCNDAAMWIRGGGYFVVNGFESDNCSVVFKSTGWTRPDTGELVTGSNTLGTLTVNGAKMETGGGGGAVDKGSMLFDSNVWSMATFNGVSYAGTNIFPEILCRVTPHAPGLTVQGSEVTVNGLLVFGYVRTLMHHADGENSRKWFLDRGEYEPKWASNIHGFTYNSANGGTLKTHSGPAAVVKNVRYTNRQQFLPSGLPYLWDDTGLTGLPAYTNPPS